MELLKKIASLPASPGVYMMRRGKAVIYIGKAKNLRSRVRSYFRKTGDTRYAARFLAERATDVDYIVTTNEKEALILEDTLLKKHRPRYNIRLKDDKTYVSIKLTMAEDFPRILVTRRVKDDGSRYFGPYASARGVRDTIKFLRRIFPLCVGGTHEFRNRTRPCLDYQLGLCSGPASGLISKEDYGELVRGAVMFLEGKNRVLLKGLKRQMQEASRGEDFEGAAKIRDRVLAVEATLEEQKVVTGSGADQDVFAIAGYGEGDAYNVPTNVSDVSTNVSKNVSTNVSTNVSGVVLFIRDGRLVGTRDFFFPETPLPEEELLGSLLAQFYRGFRYVPSEVLTPIKLDGATALGEWLTDKKGKKVRVRRPARGIGLRLLKMAEENAREVLRKRAAEAPDQVLEELQRRLRLKALPGVIEAFDISNIGGSHAVGAMVTFRDAKPDKDCYRRYRIKDSQGEPNDYAMLYEVLSRRYKDTRKLPLPDLILLDGGKGQLSIGVKVLTELAVRGVPIVAIAKERPGKDGKVAKGERVFLPGRKNPVMLRPGSKADLLLQRVRDEVHCFAIAYHRKLRAKAIRSVLDDVPGIGPAKKRALFERFKDLDGIRRASPEELTEVGGVTEKMAKEIKKTLG